MAAEIKGHGGALHTRHNSNSNSNRGQLHGAGTGSYKAAPCYMSTKHKRGATASKCSSQCATKRSRKHRD